MEVSFVRSQFPALDLQVNGYPAAFLDGPGGTQVPKGVLDAMNKYLIEANANVKGAFKTSQETDTVIMESREALADLLGCDGQEVAFGENTTTNMYKLAFALARKLKEGDEIIITQLDHEANRGPWEDLKERGIQIQEVKIDSDTCTLDMEDYRQQLSEKTRVVAFTYASNVVGTITDVKEIIALAHEAGALTVVDGVHYAPHGLIDVRAIEADFLLCSVYKFFGPHIGVLYGKREIFEELPALRIKPQPQNIPDKFETGTKNHEGLAGARAAVEFIAQLGAASCTDSRAGSGKRDRRRNNIISAMKAIKAYVTPLANWLIEELSSCRGVSVYVPSAPYPRTSTVSFRVSGVHPQQVAEALAQKGIFVWAGDFYASRLMESLGLKDKGGLVRVGLAPYNTFEEMERLIREVKRMI